jgi:hypothetical protein
MRAALAGGLETGGAHAHNPALRAATPRKCGGNSVSPQDPWVKDPQWGMLSSLNEALHLALAGDLFFEQSHVWAL